MIKLKSLIKENQNSTPAHEFLKKYYSKWPTPEEHAKKIRQMRNNSKEFDTSFKDKNSLKRALTVDGQTEVEIAQLNYHEALKKFNDATKKHPLHVVEVGWGFDLKNAFEKYFEVFSTFLSQFPEEEKTGLNH